MEEECISQVSSGYKQVTTTTPILHGYQEKREVDMWVHQERENNKKRENILKRKEKNISIDYHWRCPNLKASLPWQGSSPAAASQGTVLYGSTTGLQTLPRPGRTITIPKIQIILLI